ncbi:MAG: DUF4304 domain-containing protein [Cyanobacteria bacterium HKST-UBA02]|nr:DUF4304 domain-containing protein [Cyanobacteria bacterium HKST-UBA02]
MIDTERELTKLLKPHGYRRKGTCWYKTNPEVVTYLHLQKAYYGGEAFIDLRAILPELIPNFDYPRAKGYHVSFRLPLLEHTGALRELANLDDTERLAILRHHVMDVAIPLLEEMSTKEALATLANKLVGFGVAPPARAALGLPLSR